MSGRQLLRYWKHALIAAVLIGLYFASKGLPIRQNVEQFAIWLRSQGTTGLFIFWVAYTLATLFFLPVSLLSLAAGAVFGPVKGLALALGSAITGASVAFVVARHFARDAVERYAGKHPNFRAVDAAISDGGWTVVLLLRLSILIPFHVSNYALGVTRVRFSRYLFASAIGMAPGTWVYVYLGHLGHTTVVQDGSVHPTQAILIVCGLIATILVSIYLGRLARRKLAELKAADDAKEPGSRADER